MELFSCLRRTLALFVSLILVLLTTHRLAGSSKSSSFLDKLSYSPEGLPRVWLDLAQGFNHVEQNGAITRLPPTSNLQSNSALSSSFPILEDLHGSLETLQARFFAVWLGTWPDSIDWTAAVMGTHISGVLTSLTKTLRYLASHNKPSDEDQVSPNAYILENEVNKYFSQSLAYYFGEDAFAIRMQAYDDMLWVVLGWLESIKFIDLHVDRHRSDTLTPIYASQGSQWYGHQFKPSFAHRARIFFELASQGWDTTLCGGGMIWSPSLSPYKNAITNQLFISASIGMYLHFPGDDNISPFGINKDIIEQTPFQAHDERFLTTARNAYAWLQSVNMTNANGLYVDGFHISGHSGHGPEECDIRNEMVYTYNQGVVLSGLHGLWEGTGNTTYLSDGHRLVRNVISATGWTSDNRIRSPQWQGLGRAGVLEDFCDSRGDCNQDAQGFKGIFFHHLALFCEPLPKEARIPGKTFAARPEERLLHRQSCKEYLPWVSRNAYAALQTRNDDGVFGQWWGHGGDKAMDDYYSENPPRVPDLHDNATDYRNLGTVPLDAVWQKQLTTDEMGFMEAGQGFQGLHGEKEITKSKDSTYEGTLVKDVNDRGRGRTAETQGSGVAVLRALWEFANIHRGE
ncbi:MAG: hypothetical protein M1820_007891 [Bogoriella megaspora]|nr:MAG: hypothetical protein M1820_007891 [Bogoriella megaspora]